MAIYRSRGEVITPTETVQLHALFRDGNGDPVDLDAFPQVSLVQPSGNVYLSPTSAGVYRLAVGTYGFDFPTMINSSLGIWADFWSGLLSGVVVTGSFNFVIYTTQMPIFNSDGYRALGDDPGFHYSQTAIHNINKMLKALKARLNSSGLSKGVDSFGNSTYVDCDIYTVDVLVTFLANALTYFNSIPHFTFFQFSDTQIMDQFFAIIVQGAVVSAMASKALIERGREFTVTDSGVSFNPATISELLNNQATAELSAWREDVKMVKANCKPSPCSIGSFSIGNSRMVYGRLRMLRERQII